MQGLPRTVIWFGVVSLLTDASSEMIYPLLPGFLALLGATPRFIGVVEGVAETTANLLKLVSGRIADALPKKKPLTVAGYGLSSLARPLVALATAPWMVLAVRFVDRVGKGIRSSPRDALVADVTPADRRGAAYGYHRAMDNAGAVAGPLVGYALLSAGLGLTTIFALAAVPAALAMTALLLGVREVAAPAPARPRAGDGSPAALSPGLRRYLVVVALFALANASDAFLLVRAADAGIATKHVLLLWTLHNGMRAAFGRYFGALSDLVGRVRLIASGWLVYAACYLGFGFANAPWQIWLLFGAYGLYYALAEGSERALVADLAGPARGRAFGWFHAISGLAALPASIGFGWIYKSAGATAAFSVAAGLAAVAALALVAVIPRPAR